MLKIAKVIVNEKQKYALLRVGEVNAELGVYASNSYALKKAKQHMSQTQEWLQCEVKGIFDVWKLENGELVSTEAEQLQRIEVLNELLRQAEQQRNFQSDSETSNQAENISIVPKNNNEKSPLNEDDLADFRVWADGTVQEVSEEPYSWKSDDYMMVKALDEEHAFFVWQQKEREAWGYEPESWAQGCHADLRNALCACAVAGQPQAPPLG